MAHTARRILFSFVPVIIVIGGAELGLRAAGWPSATTAFVHNQPFWITDPDLRDQSFPHSEEGTTFQVSTDHQGLRAPLHDIKRAPDTLRVMAMGCSTTFGWGVDDDASYPARLQALARADGHTGLEVINAGQPGYTSFQGLWLWDEVLYRYHPDVVLLGYVVQDARKAAYTDKSQAIIQQDARFLKRHLFYRSRVYLGLRALLGQVQIRAKERADGGARGAYRVPPVDYVANLRGLIQRVEDEGGQPVLFGFPLERAGYTAEHRRIMQAASDELDVPYLDLQAPMEQASRDAQLYFTHDRGHPNAAGQDRIALWTYEWLRSHDLLGDP